jgi:hypothetical protein
MTAPADDIRPSGPRRPPAGLRRPPAAPAQWATVTRLGAVPADTAATAMTATPPVTGSLALQPPADEVVASGVPRTPELRLVTAPPGSGEDVQLWAARFAQAVVEVLGGDRPLAQLVRWTSQRVYLELERRLALLARTSDAGLRKRTIRPQVRSVHVCHPTPAAAEVSVHVRYGERSRAIAARLELVRGRWQCTVLQLG